jgi:hypothetical protein
MPGKITDLAALTGAAANGSDLLETIDVSDTSMAPTGTNKRFTLSELIAFLNANGVGGGVAASAVSFVPGGSLAANNVQAAIAELDSEKQPLDADLTTIAGLSPGTNNFMSGASNQWVSLTASQTKMALSLGFVDNTSDAGKPVSTAQQAALDLKAPLASPTFTGTVSGVTKGMVGLGSVDNTADTAKPVSTAQAAADALRVLKAGDSITGPVNMLGDSSSTAPIVWKDSTNTTERGRITGWGSAVSLRAVSGGFIEMMVAGSQKFILNATDLNLYSTLQSFAGIYMQPGQTVTLAQDPTALLHAATKRYVDAAAPGVTTQPATAFQVATADGNLFYLCNNASPITITLPTGVAANTEIHFMRDTTATLTFVAGAGASLVSADGRFTARVRYSVVTTKALGSDRWLLIGDLG